MKNILLIILLTIFVAHTARGKGLIISTGTDIARELTTPKSSVKFLNQFQEKTILNIKEKDLPRIIKLAHKAGRCGGFFIHPNLSEAKMAIAKKDPILEGAPYQLKSKVKIGSLLDQIKEQNIRRTIEALSRFNNRYYASNTGVAAAKMIQKEWSKYGSTRLFIHKSYIQPSVITEIPGTTKKDEYVIIGGHLDSINGFLFSSRKRAPGSDDNASGIATITEVLRVISESNYKPQRTLLFIGYAAEEVGLRGSSEIAKAFRRDSRKVKAVMQLDMDNYNGSKEKILLIKDYVDPALTSFMGKLIERYVKVPYGYTTCGYACSDHASWTAAGYPSAFPFEAKKKEMNKTLHTTRDILEVSKGTANHAVNFSKLGVAFMLELDAQD